MAEPVFVGAGTGTERLTAGSFTVSKTGCTAGNLLLLHMHVKGVTADWTGWNTASNIENLSGTASSTTNLRGGSEFQINVGRCTANGTCSANLSVGASGEDIAARIYEFSGEFNGTTLASVFENGVGTSDTASGSSTSFQDGPVTTNGPERLALNIGALETAQAVGAFTGETGGDWTEAVAEYVGTTITLQLQTASMPAAYTIDGGSVTVTTTPWLSIATAIIPAAAVSVSAPSLLLLGVG